MTTQQDDLLPLFKQLSPSIIKLLESLPIVQQKLFHMFDAQLDMNLDVSESEVTPINWNFNTFNIGELMLKQ